MVLTACAPKQPQIIKPLIFTPPNFRIECTGPDVPPNLPEKPTLDDLFGGLQTMAQASIDQEAALLDCEAKRKGLVDLIDLSNGAKP